MKNFFIKILDTILNNRVFRILSIILLSSIIWISFFKNSNIWYDEFYTIKIIDNNIKDIISITANDVHPPLYYLLLKVYTLIFGTGLNPLKFFSIIPLVLILILNEFEVRKLLGKKIANAFVIIFLSSAIVMEYAIEIRMYSWSMFFLYGMTLYAIKYCQKKDSLSIILMTIFSILGIYTHYYVLLSAVILYLIMILFNIKNFYKLLISGLVNLVCYLPWIGILFNQIIQVKQNFWIPEITISTILKYPYYIFRLGNFTNAYIIFISLIIILALYFILKKESKYKKESLICFITFLATCIIGITISILVKPVFYARYASISIVSCMILFLSIYIGNINSKRLRIILLILFVIFGIVSYSYRMHLEFDFSKEYINTVNKYINSDDAILFTSNVEQSVIISYYFENYNYYTLKTYNNSPFKYIKDFNDDIFNQYERIFIILFNNSHYNDDEYLLEYIDTLDLGEWCTFDIYQIYKK